MKRRDFITLVGGAAAWPVVARGQSGKNYRIGVLETIPQAVNGANFGGLREGLRQRGYVEGGNLRFEYRSADGRGERFAAFAAELVSLGVDLIVTRGTPAAQAAKAATATIPIVMAAIGEPLGVGIVATLARPGGNITGLSAFVTELSGKRIELLKEAFPDIAHVAFLQNMGNPVSQAQWDAARLTAGALGISAERLDVRNQQDIERAFATFQERKLDAMAVGIDALIQAQAETIVALAARNRIRAAYPSREFVDAGGLMSYGVNYPDLYFRSASLIDKIFKGTKPGDLPVEPPTKLELVINLKTAKVLDLPIPSSLLSRADEVIE